MVLDGGGKALNINELVRIKDGWSTIGNLKIGDQVYDMYGNLSNVTNKTEVQKDLSFYKLTLRDGRTIESCEDHNWRVWNSLKSKYEVVDTKYLVNNYYKISGGRKSHKSKDGKDYLFALPHNSLIENTKKELPLHPYIIGCLLGDGGYTQCNVTFTNKDEEILDKFNSLLPEGYYLKYDTRYCYRVARKDDSIPAFNSYLRELGMYGLKTELKSIPEQYLFSDSEDRFELLRGLMDTDGFADTTHAEFYTVSEKLSADFNNLVRSLGIACRTTTKKTSYRKDGIKVECRDCYRTSIYGKEPIFSVPRKLNIILNKKDTRLAKRHERSFITNIEYIGKKDGMCITVDNLTHTYITKDYIVTHNSYTIAGITAQVMTFDGIKRFDKETFLNPPTAKVSIGAAITDKSSELITKVVDGLGFLSTEKDLGVWGDPEDDEYLPNPFSRNWEGDVKPGNKKNPYRYTYKVETKAGWKPRGTKTALFHVNYSDKKQDGAQAGAGGRVNLSVYEEVGLMPNFKEALFSNIPTVSNDGEQYGVQVALGTSGNIDLVQQSKQVFNNPQDYNFLAFENIWEDDEHARHIGLFLPAYLADSDFKDENGNTDIEAALEHYYERRLEESQKKDPSAIYNEKMNYPLVPSDMWISNKGSYFPQMELIERERELLKDHTYRTIGRPSKLIWDAESFNGVKVEVNQDDEPFYEFPFDRSMSSIKGCPLIFHEPETIKSSIPSDMYLFTLDPYVSDNIDEGGSVGAFYGFLNPKYWKEGIKQTMVCSYVGKPSEGKDKFYEQCEKLIQYYGNCPRSFWYEANRGDSVKGYFLKKNKLYLLALEPTKEKGSNIYAKKVQNYGVRVNSRTDKIEMIDDTSEWLLSHCYDDKRVVETIPDIFFVRQAIQFNLEPGSNFDAVSSVIIYPLALKELQHIVESEYQKKNKHNPLAGLSMNVNIFKQDRFEEFKRKYEHTIRE